VDVLAIIAAYNEADIIAATVGDLVAQGARVHLIDHGSTDDTVREASRHAGERLEIERLPPADRFPWAELLRHKEAIAARHPGSFIIHADADELRESPWPGVGLVEGLEEVARHGYNAVDFAVLDFAPLVGVAPYSGGDLRAAFTHFAWGQAYNRLQIRCWRQPVARVDLASSGGHEARFEGRRVFPVRFVLRHYPIRSEAHGAHKVPNERRARFLDEERARGWHVQYDAWQPGASFLRQASELERFDDVVTRRQLALREAQAREDGRQSLAAQLAHDRDLMHAALAEAERLRATTAVAEHEREAACHDARLADERTQQLRAALATVEERLDALLSSRTWTWTAPARLAWEALRARR
jgi:hypothetical protein